MDYGISWSALNAVLQPSEASGFNVFAGTYIKWRQKRVVNRAALMVVRNRAVTIASAVLVTVLVTVLESVRS